MNLLWNRYFVVGLIAFLTRLTCAFVFAFDDPAFVYYDGITRPYLQAVEHILEGRGFVLHVDIAPISEPASKWSYEPFIDRPLGYPLLILLPLSIFFDPLAVQLFQCLLSVCSCIFLLRIGESMVSQKTAFVAALLYSCWPLSARVETLVLPDAVMSFFLLGGLWFFLKGFDGRPDRRWIFLSGAFFGLGMLMRPDVALLPFFFIALMWFLPRLRSFLRHSLFLIAGVLLIVVPHTIRNFYATNGSILPFGLGNGISLWEGISQFGDTLGTIYGDERMAHLEGYRSWPYPNGVERDKRRFKEAVRIILENPVWYAGVMIRRIPVLLQPDGIVVGTYLPSTRKFFSENPGKNFANYLSAYPIAAFLQIIIVLSQGLAILAAVIAAARLPRDSLLWIPATVVFYYVVIHIATNTEPRYFYPAIPFVLLLASKGWEALGRGTKA